MEENMETKRLGGLNSQPSPGQSPRVVSYDAQACSRGILRESISKDINNASASTLHHVQMV